MHELLPQKRKKLHPRVPPLSLSLSLTMLGTRQMMTCSLTHTHHVAVSPPTTAPQRGFPDRSGLPSLIWLYLYKNKITEIGEGDLVNIPSLEILRIYDNSISKVRV